MELNVKAFAVTGAIFGGVHFFFLALFAMQSISLFCFNNQTFELFSSGYPGFEATILGAIVGLFYGIICGGICFGLFAWVYNIILKKI